MEQFISEKDFYVIRDCIKQICGISLNFEKEYLVRQKLDKFVRARGMDSFAEFADALRKNKENSAWYKEIISGITTNETFFFRDQHPFQNLFNVLLPEIFAKRQKARLWSAGCSTGQEPYTLSMIFEEIKEKTRQNNIQIEIIASDIDDNALQYARNGVYVEPEIKRGLDRLYLDKYFTVKGKGYFEAKDVVKKNIVFKSHSLHNPSSITGSNQAYFDIILARNVLIYFEEEDRKKTIGFFYDSLADNGVLILGASESLYGLTDQFETESLGKTIVYRKKNGNIRK